MYQGFMFRNMLIGEYAMTRGMLLRIAIDK